jgi:hypothetical protein
MPWLARHSVGGSLAGRAQTLPREINALAALLPLIAGFGLG